MCAVQYNFESHYGKNSNKNYKNRQNQAKRDEIEQKSPGNEVQNAQS